MQNLGKEYSFFFFEFLTTYLSLSCSLSCLQGCGVTASSMLHGMVFKKEAEGDVTSVKDAKIAVFSCPFDSMVTETKVRGFSQSKVFKIRLSIFMSHFHKGINCHDCLLHKDLKRIPTFLIVVN